MHVAVGGMRVPDPVVGSWDPMRWFTGLGFTPFPAWGGVRPESAGQEREGRESRCILALPRSVPVYALSTRIYYRYRSTRGSGLQA